MILSAFYLPLDVRNCQYLEFPGIAVLLIFDIFDQKLITKNAVALENISDVSQGDRANLLLQLAPPNSFFSRPVSYRSIETAYNITYNENSSLREIHTERNAYLFLIMGQKMPRCDEPIAMGEFC